MDVLVRPLLNSDMSISRFWVLGFGFWVLGFGFGFWVLVLGFGFWVLGFGFGFWVLGFGFSVLVFGFMVFGFWFDIKQNPRLEPGGFSEAKIQ